jgi:hypothetical protein
LETKFYRFSVKKNGSHLLKVSNIGGLPQLWE